ncbi:MAG: DUF2975 domain-containing protein [Prevotella sp.]|nr:DUF2975 domain-containing protein [Prevotella sp.]
MNKKLKIYSTLFVVVLIVLGFTNTFHYYAMGWSPAPDNNMEFAELPSDYMSCDTLPDGGTVSYGHPYYTYDVNVHPWSRPDHKVLLSTAQGQTYQVEMQKIKVGIPASRANSNFPMYFIGSATVVSIIVFVWILYMVVNLIVKIRRGEIFVTKVAKYLETTGILLSVLYLYELVVSYLITQYFISHIHLADHSIVFKNECNSMYILTGLALMIISQIILKGKDLKEEQELTI